MTAVARTPEAATALAAAAAPLAAAAAPLAAAALDWYATNARDLAFRRTSDPWAILVSEVMAQQTQAARAADAWLAFIERYPTAAAFAATTPADAIRAWRGLGYNRRAIALRAAAIRIVEDHAGRVPDDLEALEALPGIGPYTARAVLAIAFGRPVAPLDTNIRRVLDRALGLLSAPRTLQHTADAFVPPAMSAEWTHALMDIGAVVCRKRMPRCGECPLAATCAWLRAGQPADWSSPPTRAPRAAAPHFASTTRWLRGRILERLRDSPNGTWHAFDASMGEHDIGAVQAALAGLASEGLLERHPDRRSLARLAGG